MIKLKDIVQEISNETDMGNENDPSFRDAGDCHNIHKNMKNIMKEEKNSEEGKLRVSKEEEMRALQFIRRMILPTIVKDWNKRFPRHKIKEKNINHNMVKKGHQIWPAENGLHDYVEYISPTPKINNPISFRILKGRDGEVKVVFSIIGDSQNTHPMTYTVGNWSAETGWLMENTLITENIDRLSKKEELYLLVYLQKTLMPQMLEDKYNHFLKKYPARYPEGKYPRITVRDVLKNLKKIRMDVDNASYESIINDDVDFAFHFQKKDGKFMIGIQGPMNVDWSWYSVKGTNDLMESVVVDKYSISKQEEFQALDFIKKRIIPQSVDHRNETSMGYAHEPLVKISDVLKTLKKISHTLYPSDGLRDNIVYQVLINNDPYTYSIYKSGEGKLRINKREDGTSIPVK